MAVGYWVAAGCSADLRSWVAPGCLAALRCSVAVRCLGTRYGRISHREATLATADQDAGEEPGACLAEAPSRGVERLKQDRLFDLFPMKVRVHRCHATPHAHIIDRCLCALPIRSLHRSPVYNTRAHIMLRGSKAADWIGLRKSYPTSAAALDGSDRELLCSDV